MDCAQYKDWLKDAALEGLAPRQEAELRAHLAACSNCRAEVEQLRLFLSAVDQAVTRSAEAEPAPGFAARVRQRIAEKPAAGGWFPAWAPVTAVAALAVVLLMVWLLPQEPPAPNPTVAPPVAPPMARDNPDKGREAPPPVVAKFESNSAGKRTPQIVAARASLVVLIPRDEQEGLRQFIRASQEFRGEASTLSQRAPNGVKPVESEAMVIPSIALERVEVRPIPPVGTDSQTQ